MAGKEQKKEGELDSGEGNRIEVWVREWVEACFVELATREDLALGSVVRY